MTCIHGKRKNVCKECGGATICEHGRQRPLCKDCYRLGIGGSQICEHMDVKSRCKECHGASLCEHGRMRLRCTECGSGSQLCIHKRRKYSCKDCGGKGVCIHGQRKSRCAECGGSELCMHGLQKTYCRICEGAAFCEHGTRRRRCPECDGLEVCKANVETMCQTLGSSRYRGYCARCFSYYFADEPVAKNFRVKEKAWAEFLKERYPDVDIIFNKTLGACSRYRPDAFFDFGTHVMVLENNEHQHKRSAYTCDNRRNMALMEDAGMRPIVICNFNPDDYKRADGENVTSCWGMGKDGMVRLKRNKKSEWTERLEAMAQLVDHYRVHIPAKEVTIEWLFYDELID